MANRLPRNPAELIQLARDQGWSVTRTPNGHHKLVNPKGELTMVGDPKHDQGDWRAVKNNRARLWRAGLRPLTRIQHIRAQEANVEYFTAPPTEERKMTKKRTPRGLLPNAVLAAIEKLGPRSTGFEAADLMPRVMTVSENVTREQVGIQLTKLAAKGVLERLSQGRYRVRPAGQSAPPLAAVGFAPPRIDLNALVVDSEDMKVLDDVLVCLAKAEAVIRKHMAFEQQVAVFKQMFGGAAAHAEKKDEPTGDENG